MRKIEFPPGTRAHTRPRVSTLAWATNRRGRNPWRSVNVTAQISEYLAENGVRMTSPEVSSAIKWVVDHKYGAATKHEGGKRTLEFNFFDDVILSGHDPMREPNDAPARYKTVTAGPAAVTHEAQMNGNVSVASPVELDLALPGAPEHPEVYGLEKLNKLLTVWSDNNPEAYANWVDRALSQLGAVLDV